MSGPRPAPPISDLARNYLRNRSEFYAALLPRLIDERQRLALSEAAAPLDPDPALLAAVEKLPQESPAAADLQALALRDALKKPSFGYSLGRTAISVADALARAQFVEETGLLLFDRLQSDYPSLRTVFADEANRRRAALAALLRLEDALRYHRFPSAST